MSKVMEHLRLLGLRVQDKVTGLKGVVTSVGFDLYGCVQVVVKPKAQGGECKDGVWLDAHRLKVLSDKPVMELPDFVEDAKPKGPAQKPRSGMGFDDAGGGRR